VRHAGVSHGHLDRAMTEDRLEGRDVARPMHCGRPEKGSRSTAETDQTGMSADKLWEGNS